MELEGQRLIPAPRERVWEALNDPDTLAAAIPGCETLERTSDTELVATVRVSVGPVRARFKGRVTLSNVNAPASYTISGEGQGGAAGFAKGKADVALQEAAEGTELTYKVEALVGGKLAQVGSRLIEGTARKLSDQFFDAFSALVAGGAAIAAAEAPRAAGSEPEAAVARPEPEAAERRGVPMYVWLIGLAIVVIVILAIVQQ